MGLMVLETYRPCSTVQDILRILSYILPQQQEGGQYLAFMAQLATLSGCLIEPCLVPEPLDAGLHCSTLGRSPAS